MSLSKTTFPKTKETSCPKINRINRITYQLNKKISLLSQKQKRDKQGNLKPYHKETPLCTSQKAAYTVEAAVTMPVFMCMIVAVLFFFRILMVQAGVQVALNDTARIMAVMNAIPANASGQVSQQSVEQMEVQGSDEISQQGAAMLCNGNILKRKVPVKFIEGQLAGMSYEASEVEHNYIHLTVEYVMKVPLGMFGTITVPNSQSAVCRKWIGWDPLEDADNNSYVYVTEYGEAYHSRRDCAYLNPGIQAVAQHKIGDYRNSSGGKYRSCPICKGNRKGISTVYITKYGDVYHSRVNCSGLKRTIYRISLEEAEKYQPCNKCVEK